MRVATVRTGSATRAVRVDGDHLTYLPYADVGELIASGADWQERAADGAEETAAAAAAVYAPLVTTPEKIVCVGLNYADHAEDAGLALPDYPTFFAKYSRSMIGAHDPLMLPVNSDAVDWEDYELAWGLLSVTGQDVDDGQDPHEALVSYASRGPDEAARAGLALAFALWEGILASPWSTDWSRARVHLGFLERQRGDDQAVGAGAGRTGMAGVAL